jgi:hypothetical protein
MQRLLLAAISLLCAGPALAQVPRSNIGTLTCTLAAEAEKQSPSTPGEERAMRCAFKPTQSGAEQTFSGTIRKIGAGQQLQGKLVLIWVVEAPTGATLKPGLLAQSYVGRQAEGAPKGAAGAGLVGETNRDIVMKPETQPGAAESGVVTMMELKLASVPA